MKDHLRVMPLLLLTALLTGHGWALTFHSSFQSIKTDAVPGQTINRSFALTLAKEEQATRFRVHVEDWWRSEDGKQSFYKAPGTLLHSCALWVVLNPTEAVIGPGGTLAVRVTIAVPKPVKPGGYWCALTVDQVPDPGTAQREGVDVRYLASVSVGIFVNILPVKRAATVQAVQFTAGTAHVTLRNDGNCALGAGGRMEFIAPGGKTPLAVLSFPRTTVLPEPITTAILAAGLPSPAILPPGRYQVRIIIDIGLDHYIGVQKEMEITREMFVPAKEADPVAK